jgi:hypothetical protein
MTPIRKLSIGTNFKESMNYSVGTEHSIYMKGEVNPIRMAIHSIEETEKHYVVYIKNEDDVFQWKKIPKNDQTSVEFYID